MPIVLASASPRRRELLAQMGIVFDVLVTDTDENSDLRDGAALVELLSFRKADAARQSLRQQQRWTSDTAVIGCDTVVCCDGEILGKPKDQEDARRMLGMLSGKTHTVTSGVTILFGEKRLTCHQTTEVTFGTMSNADIQAYIASGEPMDKAGAYAVQGLACRYISGICGDYFNVVGLPLHLLYQMAEQLGLKL